MYRLLRLCDHSLWASSFSCSFFWSPTCSCRLSSRTPFSFFLVDCWYMTPPNIQIKSPKVPMKLECLSHITKLITTVNSLFTMPRTVNPVAEIPRRHEKPKKEMAKPNKQDSPTGKTTGKVCQSGLSVIPCLSFCNSPIITSSSGKKRRASRLL